MAHTQPASLRMPPLPRRLEELQRVGRLGPTPFTAVPPSLQTPVEQVADAAGELKSAVLLGFTRDGCHLVSYTTLPAAAADGVEGYALQLWSFRAGTRCRRLWSVPLFRTQPYLDSLNEEEEFMTGTAADDMLVTVAEPPDSSLLVVHGRSADPTGGRDHHLPNFVTIIPGTLHAGAAQLQVVHLSYNTTFPHAPFNPFHFLTPLDSLEAHTAASSLGSSAEPRSSSGTGCPALGGGSSSGWRDGAPLAICLYKGDGVRYVHAVASRQAVVLQGPLPGQGEDDSSSSRFPSPEPPAAVAEAAEAAEPGAAEPGAASDSLPSGSPPRWPPQRGSMSRAPHSASPGGSPWARQGRNHWQHTPHRQQQQQQRMTASPGEGSECELELGARLAVVPTTHAIGSGCMQQQQQQQQILGGACLSCSGGSRALAAVSVSPAPQQLDLEACLFAALRQQGLPPSALVDYAAAPVQGGVWEDQDGLLLLAVLRLARAPAADAGAAQSSPPAAQQQPQHRSACVLLHAAAADGAARLVEWLEPSYPWHDDLSAFLVQQTAFAGLAFEKAPAFFAEFLGRRYGSQPQPRSRLPLVLSNRTVLGSGSSLPHICHPWLPQAILGYSSRSGSAI